MSNTKSLVVLEPPLHRPVRLKKRLRVLSTLALTILAGVLAVIFFRGSSVDEPIMRLLPITVAEPDAPIISVGPVIVAEPSRATPLPIQVGPSQLISQGGWLRIGGLSVRAVLSEGYVTKPGVWMVPVAGLVTLKLTTPPMNGVRSKIRIALLSPAGMVLTEAQSVLAVMPARHVGAQPGPLAGTTPCIGETTETTVSASRPAAAWIWPGAKQEAKSLMRRGEETLSAGSIGAARSIHEYAAESLRWPAAALALAATYDPHELAHSAPLVTPDRNKARFWYLKAQELANARINYYLHRLLQSKPRPDP